jgi:hypothetical protein
VEFGLASADTGGVATRLGERCARRWLPGLLALGLAGALAPDSAANEIEEDKGTIEEAHEDAELARTIGERFDVGFYPSADFYPAMHFGEFDANAYQPGGRVKVTMPVAPTAALRLIVRGSALLTEFSDVSTNLFDPGGPKTSQDPFGNLYSTSFQLQGGWRTPWSGLFSEEERWTLAGEGFARSRWEEGSSFATGVDGGGALGVGYQVGEWLEVLLGGGIQSRHFHGGVGFYPLVEVTWAFAPGWELRQRGRGGEIQYDIDEDVSVFVTGQLQSRSYRLADRPGVGEGRMRDRSVPVGLGVRWDARPGLEFTLTAGAVVQRKLRVENEDGDHLGHVRAGPAPFVSFQIELRPDRLARGRGASDEAQGDLGGDSSSSLSSRSR